MKIHVTNLVKEAEKAEYVGDGWEPGFKSKLTTILDERDQGVFSSWKLVTSHLSSKFGAPEDNWIAFEDGRLTNAQYEDVNGNAVDAAKWPKDKDLYLANYDLYVEFISDVVVPSVDEMARELKVEKY